jgi:hypothetical protein
VRRVTDSKEAQAFLSLIHIEQYAPRSIEISYIAFKHHDLWMLYAARAFVRNIPSDVQPFEFVTDSIRAGRFSISGVGCSPSELIDGCLGGVFLTPHVEVRIFEESYSPSVRMEPFHPAGGQSRISVLTIASQLSRNLRFDPEIRLELNAADSPFGTFEELVNLLSLGRENDSEVTIEFVSYQAASIYLPGTFAKDGQANIEVALASGLDRNRLSLGVRRSRGGIAAPPQDVVRFSIKGSDFDWAEKDGVQRGNFTFEVGTTDVLQCFVNFNGVNYHSYWLSDPSTTANPRRVALSTFDPSLEITSDHLFKDVDGKIRSKEFEAGLSWMFWMLGFSPVHLGAQNVKAPNDAPDLLLCDARSNFLVVEATVGSLQNNNKIGKLWERTTRIREALQRHSLGHLEVMPVVVTKSEEKFVEAELEAAAKLGVSVVTRETLQALIQRTDFFPDADSNFDRLRAIPSALPISRVN